MESEHYVIRTNDSIETGVALEVKLELLYRIWQQIFVGYYASEADVIAWFDGRSKALSGNVPQHQVVYFRDREEFKRSLRAAVPDIDIPTGMYLDQTRTAYFFAGKDSDDRNMYHEATHQLFHESRPVAPDVGRRANFWIVEGIAMYMESLRQEDGYYVLGGFDDERLHAARYRLLHDNFYVPLQEFVGYGMEKIQKDPRIGMLYSQAAGLTHFLIHYDNGRYREALVAYLDGRLYGPRPARHAGQVDRDQFRGPRQAVSRVHDGRKAERGRKAEGRGRFTSTLARATGIEPATTGSTVRYSNQLSYAPKLLFCNDLRLAANLLANASGRQPMSTRSMPCRWRAVNPLGTIGASRGGNGQEIALICRAVGVGCGRLDIPPHAADDEY